MIRLIHKLTIGLSAIVAIVALSANFFWNPVSSIAVPESAESAAFCPIALKSEGSTTVFPITRDSEAPFEAAWAPGTDVQLQSIGSGAGIIALTAGSVESAPSSRPLNAGEATGKYPYKIALDAFVIGVWDNPDNSMDFLDGGITKAQLATIYSAGAGITTLEWFNLNPSWPHRVIVPRARITASGSQPDFIAAHNLNISAAVEDATIAATGLPRQVESSDMANAVIGFNDQITYTSLANLPSEGGPADLKVVPVSSGGPFVTPSQTTVLDGSYPMPRQLFLIVRDKAQNPRTGPDNSNFVRADDWVNYVRNQTSLIAAEGFVPWPLAARPPFPDWDINLDGQTNLADLGQVAGKWGASSNCKGWIRADANNNGNVSLTDIGVVTGKWAQTGFGCAVPANPCTE